LRALIRQAFRKLKQCANSFQKIQTY
jgi:hypothetical protein